MQHMDADETYRENAWRKLHKNVTSYIEQILEASSHEASAVQPLPSLHHNHTNKANRLTGHCCISKDELISNVHVCIPSHRRAIHGRPIRTYNSSRWTQDVGWRTNRERWIIGTNGERVREIVQAARLDDTYIYIYIYIYIIKSCW